MSKIEEMLQNKQQGFQIRDITAREYLTRIRKSYDRLGDYVDHIWAERDKEQSRRNFAMKDAERRKRIRESMQ